MFFLFWSKPSFFPSCQIEIGHRSEIPDFTEMLLETLLSIPQLHLSPGSSRKQSNCFESLFAFSRLEVGPSTGRKEMTNKLSKSLLNSLLVVFSETGITEELFKKSLCFFTFKGKRSVLCIYVQLHFTLGVPD